MGLKNHLRMFISRLIPYSRKKMVEDLNNYLIAYKLFKPAYLSGHKIEYYINKDKEVTSLKEHKIEYILAGKKAYGLEVTYFYFHNGVMIKLKENINTSYAYGSKKLRLSIKIHDTTMKSIMTDEFKETVGKIFQKTIYTSDDFSSYDMDYETSVVGSRRQITKGFIKLNMLIEKLGADREKL
ncbi:hypothetical protein D3C71_1141680 [compost metagenome]